MLSRRMIPKEDEPTLTTGADAEVTRQDQDRINRFSRLHQREKTLVESVTTKSKEKEDLVEISTELELSVDLDNDDEDENELIPYKIGETFAHLPAAEVQTLLASSTERLDAEIEAVEAELETIREEMGALKGELYARFGRGINLEG